MCSACVLVVDARGGGDSIKATAAVLYDLFTDPGVLRGVPRLLVAANKGLPYMPVLPGMPTRQKERL